jgi:hypothetical protein
MRTKAVYVLTSNKEDYYYECTFLSIYSLKLHNPEMQAVLVTDAQTNDSMGIGRQKIKAYFDEMIVVDIPKRFNQKQRSRYLKTSLRQRIPGDFLFIDDDTIVTASLAEADAFECALGAVPDCNKVGSRYYNSGVFYVKDVKISYEFYLQWHELWLKGVAKGYVKDQASLDSVNKNMNFVIQEIPESWNYQKRIKEDEPLDPLRIVHYFTAVKKKENYVVASPEVFEAIKKTDDIPGFIKDYLLVPSEMFKLSVWVLPVHAPYTEDLFYYYPSWRKVVDGFSHMCLFFLEHRQRLLSKMRGKRDSR